MSEEAIRTNVNKDVIPWLGVSRVALHGLGWKRSVRRCTGLRWVGTAVNC